LIRRQNFVIISHSVGAYVEGPKHFWHAGNTHHPYMCYLAEFCRSQSNRTGVSKRSQKFADARLMPP